MEQNFNLRNFTTKIKSKEKKKNNSIFKKNNSFKLAEIFRKF